MSIHDPTLYVGFPTPVLTGHVRTHSVEAAVVLSPVSPTCPASPYHRYHMFRLQDNGKNHDTLISLDSICLCAHNCSTCLLYIILEFYIPLFKCSVLDKLLRYMACTGIEAANITCRIWSFSLKVFVWLKAKRAGAVTAANAISWFRKTAPQRGIQSQPTLIWCFGLVVLCSAKVAVSRENWCNSIQVSHDFVFLYLFSLLVVHLFSSLFLL